MDKYEYNLRNEEINALIGRREFQKAAAIADTIDWTKVRSVKTLCKISDLYKINRRYKESKILLEQALDRCPTGKSIVSSLCELCIKMNDVVGAMEYYKLFVQMAPTDNIKFILLYKIYESEEATLDERIEVLEELKKRERIEKWCYELAYLYHRIGLTTRCVEECDDLILWFREGKYVKKAMELKMLHQQLTQSQENLYQNMLDPKERMERLDQIAVHEAEEEKVVVDEIPEPDPEDVLVKTVDVGQYSTINIQKALEESIKDALGSESTPESTVTIEEGEDSTIFMPDNIQEIPIAEDKDPVAEAILAPLLQDTGEMQELFVDMETGELELDDSVEDSSEAAEEEQVIEVENEEANEPIDDSVSESEIVAFPDMPVTGDTIIYNKGDIVNQVTAAVLGEEVVAEASVEEETAKPVAPAVDMSSASKEELMELIDRKVAEALANAMAGQSMTAAVQNKPDMAEDVPPRSMQRMLTQEYDGQISLVVPETEKLEKQITGQINIEEYLANWENTKKQNQQKHEEEIKKRLEQQTGNLFTEFEAKARDGILAKIELEDTESGKPIDADKEYEEYLKKIMAEDELPEVEELEEAPEEVEVLPVEEVPEDIPEVAVEEEIPEPAVEEVVPESVAEEVDEEEVSESAVEEAEDEEIPESVVGEDDDEEVSEPEDEPADNNSERDDEPVTASGSREMTDEEMSLFSQFVQTKKAKENLTHALDSISLASYTGNVFVTGDTGEEPIELAKAVVQYIKMTDGNFSGKIGKVSGSLLNDKDVTSTVERLKNGGLIIEKASDMSDETVTTLIKVLNQENLGILVVMQDTKNEMNKLFNHFDSMNQMFNVNIEIEELSDDALVAYGRKYAERMEYAIDEMGILALHTRIDEMQTSDHIVTVADVKDIVDEAIDHATRFSPKHITDVLFGKRYDDDDMIILKERDFIN